MKSLLIFFYLTIPICFGTIIEQCDYNFFLTSDKKICQDDICTKEFFGLFTLDKGSRICLIRNDGSRLSFSLQSISMHYYYKDYYYACVPSMKVSTEYKCINSDNCNAEMCKPTVLSSGPETLPRSTNSTDFFYTGCIYQGWCTGWCFYDLNDRCGWGLVEIIPQTCYKVLRRERSEWIAEIVYEDSEVRNTIYLSQSNPIITKPFAMTINSMILQSEPIQNSRYLLEVTPILYRYVQACERNFPITGMIGDYQQSLDRITTTYPLNNIQCRGASCEIACTIPTSPISRYLNSSGLNTKLEDIPYVISRPDLKSLAVRREVDAHLTLTAVTGDVKNLKVVSPNCKISSIYTMGCTGCFESSIVGLLASDMRNPGIVTVESNCTLSSYSLKCQKDPYTIRVIGTPSCCFLRHLNNKKVGENTTFCIDYIFEGSLTPVSLLTQSSSKDSIKGTAKLLFENPNFLNSLMITGGLTAVFSIAARSLSYYFSLRVGRQLGKESSPS